jgi:hypothetical protein
MIPDNLMYSYMAGWTDGDGCLHVSKINKSQNRFILKITDIEPLLFFKNKLNLENKILFKKPDKRGFKTKPMYALTINSKKALPFIKNIAPYLIEKQFKAIEYIKAFEGEVENFSHKQHTDEEFFAWLAGYIEAEGHIKAKIRKQLKKKMNKEYVFTEIYIQLVNTNLDVMQFVTDKLKKLNILDSKIILQKQIPKSRPCIKTGKVYARKPLYRLFAGSTNFLKLQEKIVDYFIISRKKNKIFEGVAIYKQAKFKRKTMREYFNETK